MITKYSGNIHLEPVFVRYEITDRDVEEFNRTQVRLGLEVLSRREAEPIIIDDMIGKTLAEMRNAYGILHLDHEDADVTEDTNG
jgi:hypothetical protein